MQDINQLRAMIKAIPATPEGDQKIAMLANSPDPMKRMLAGIEANERARTRQSQKAMQGQQQQGRPPVVQEKLAQLADSGLGSLDVGQGMFDERSYATGGIVAFEDGGEVRHFYGGGPSDPGYEALEDYDPNKFTKNEGLGSDITNFFRSSFNQKMKIDPDTGKPITLGDYLRKMEAKKVAAASPAAPAAAPVVNPNAPAANPAKPNAPAVNPAKPNAPLAKSDAKAPSEDEQFFSKLEGYLKGDPAERAAARKDARDFAMLETGLEMLGGESPYWAQNVGKAGARGARSYQERLTGLRRDERDVGKGLAELGLEKYKLGQARSLAELQRQTQKDVANIYASSRGDADDKTRAGVIKGVTASVDKRLGLDTNYMKLKTPAEKAQYRNKLIQDELNLYNVDSAAAPGKSWEGWSGGPQKG